MEEGACWLKFTKPAAAGYVVSFESGVPALEPALPLEYLARLILQNELFADSVTFAGVAGTRHLPRILTRQPHLPGEAASREEIVAMMVEGLGFRPLQSRYSVGYADSLTFVRDDVAVFDLRPANVVRTPEEVIAPSTRSRPAWMRPPGRSSPGASFRFTLLSSLSWVPAPLRRAGRRYQLYQLIDPLIDLASSSQAV